MPSGSSGGYILLTAMWCILRQWRSKSVGTPIYRSTAIIWASLRQKCRRRKTRLRCYTGGDDDTPADHGLSYIKDRALSGRRGPLRLVEGDFCLSVCYLYDSRPVLHHGAHLDRCSK